MLLGAARCCSVLLSAARPCLMAIKTAVRSLNSRGIVSFQFFVEHCVGAHKAQEILAETFGSFDHPELGSTEQG